jgi:hypothetical protein
MMYIYAKNPFILLGASPALSAHIHHEQICCRPQILHSSNFRSSPAMKSLKLDKRPSFYEVEIFFVDVYNLHPKQQFALCKNSQRIALHSQCEISMGIAQPQELFSNCHLVNLIRFYLISLLEPLL